MIEVFTLLVGGVAMILGLGFGLGVFLDRFVWPPAPAERDRLSSPEDRHIDFAEALRPVGPLPRKGYPAPSCFDDLGRERVGK